MCRSFLQPWKDPHTGEYQEYGRLNLGVMSINIPYIALMSETKSDFWDNLRKIGETVAEQQARFVEKIMDSSVEFAPIIWKHGSVARLKPNTTIGDFLRENPYLATVSIGYMGMAEAAKRFDIDYVSDEGKEFAKKIFGVLNDICDEWKEKTGVWYSVYGTPAESLTTKFAKALKDFPVIRGVNDKDYVTNSYHVPVTTEIDVFDKFAFEKDLQKLSGGGAISYCEVPDVRNNPDAVLEIMRYIYDNIMYAEINTTNGDVCYKCGFEGEIEIHPDGSMTCPNCGNTDERSMYVVRRLCGYLGNITKGTSKGRLGDILSRVKHA